MMHKKLTVVLSVLITLLTGCGSPNSHLLSKKEPLIDSEHGVVVVSLGSATMPRPAIFITTTRSDGKPTNFVLHTTANNLNDGAWNATEAVRAGPEGGRRLLLAYSALPGNYSIDAVNLNINGYPASYSGTVQLPRPYRFVVEAGKITYVGVVEVNMTTGSNRIGQAIPALSMQVPSRMSVRLLDEFEEDDKILKKMRPELQTAPVLRGSAR